MLFSSIFFQGGNRFLLAHIQHNYFASHTAYSARRLTETYEERWPISNLLPDMAYHPATTHNTYVFARVGIGFHGQD